MPARISKFYELYHEYGNINTLPRAGCSPKPNNIAKNTLVGTDQGPRDYSDRQEGAAWRRAGTCPVDNNTQLNGSLRRKSHKGRPRACKKPLWPVCSYIKMYPMKWCDQNEGEDGECSNTVTSDMQPKQRRKHAGPVDTCWTLLAVRGLILSSPGLPTEQICMGEWAAVPKSIWRNEREKHPASEA